MVDHDVIIEAIKAKEVPVHFDDQKKLHFVIYDGRRYNLTSAEADEVHAHGEHENILLHGWDAFLQTLGIKSGN